MVFNNLFLSFEASSSASMIYFNTICKYNIVHRKALDGMQSSDSEQNFKELLNCNHCISLPPLNF